MKSIKLAVVGTLLSLTTLSSCGTSKKETTASLQANPLLYGTCLQFLKPIQAVGDVYLPNDVVKMCVQNSGGYYTLSFLAESGKPVALMGAALGSESHDRSSDSNGKFTLTSARLYYGDLDRKISIKVSYWIGQGENMGTFTSVSTDGAQQYHSMVSLAK